MPSLDNAGSWITLLASLDLVLVSRKFADIRLLDTHLPLCVVPFPGATYSSHVAGAYRSSCERLVLFCFFCSATLVVISLTSPPLTA